MSNGRASRTFNIFRQYPDCMLSSSSRKKIIRPNARLTPWLRAADAPLPEVFMNILSRLSKTEARDWDAGTSELSSTTMTSPSEPNASNADATETLSCSGRLYVGIIMECVMGVLIKFT